MSFEEHAADVLHALRTFHISTFDNSHDPNAPPSPYWAFLRFVVRRCFLKIAERISNGNKIWRIHPVSVLRSWQPGDAFFKRTEFVLQHPILQATLEVYDVKPVSQTADGRATYYFATDNAKAWAKVACALFGVLEEKLMTLYFDGHTPPKQVPRATMDAESIIIVSDYLDMFSVILDLAPVKEILKHTSYTSRLEPLEEPALASKYSSDAKTCMCLSYEQRTSDCSGILLFRRSRCQRTDQRRTRIRRWPCISLPASHSLMGQCLTISDAT